jgi:hypothetical protein
VKKYDSEATTIWPFTQFAMIKQKIYTPAQTFYVPVHISKPPSAFNYIIKNTKIKLLL